MSKHKSRIKRIEHQLQPPKVTLHILLPGEQPPPAEPGDEVIIVRWDDSPEIETS